MLEVDAANSDVFNFQRSLNIEAINNETKALDRKAHLFWEIPAIDAKVYNFMDSISISGDAKQKLVLRGDTKDAKTFYTVKKRKAEQNIKLELSFVDSLL